MKCEDKVRGLRIKKHKGRETQDFLLDVKRIAEGEAFEYVMGEVDFCGAKIDLSLRPMIPRRETEYWVAQVIHTIKNENENKGKKNEAIGTDIYLDLFCGSSCVGMAILKNISESQVTFVDIDSITKEQVALCRAKNKIDESRVEVYSKDVGEFFASALRAGKKFAHIFAIPPYVPPSMKDEVMQELHSERELFFFDKEDGYYFHVVLLKNAHTLLEKNGILYVEFDMTQREKMERLTKEYGYSIQSVYKDPYGHDCAFSLMYAPFT